ncbi:GspH/FimT family pseudopilin [Pseudoalteromonas piscicida]|nr:GspH/FimT family pseudopilin [Pseudoalteromonas piscicida]
MHRHMGFSLMESLVCLAIITIVSLFSLPSLTALFEFDKPKIKLEALRRAINFARIQAVASSATVTLCPLRNNRCDDKEWHTQLTVFIDYHPQGEFSGDDYKLAVVDSVDSGDTLTYPRNGIIFRRFGHLAGLYNGTFVYCSASSTVGLSLSVSYTGRSTLKDTDECQK